MLISKQRKEEAYRRIQEYVKVYHRDLFDFLGIRWRGGDGSYRAVLDVGCSYGYMLELFREHGYEKLYGLDVSAYAITEARKTLTRLIFTFTMQQSRFRFL